MIKSEFFKLFELDNVFNENQGNIPFSFSLHDRFTGTNTFVFFGFYAINNVKISIECVEFSSDIQELDICLSFDNETVLINTDSVYKNNLFPFVNFHTDLDASLRFLAGFINKIWVHKYKLIGKIVIH